MEKNWSKYEEQVYNDCKAHYHKSNVSKNIKIIGKLSKRSRQVDVLIEDVYKKIIIDCKYYDKKVNIKVVESFIGMLDDLGADYGILITNKGYSKSAMERAHNDSNHVELDIYSLEELKGQFQSEYAIPYAGTNGAMCLAPLGWCIDGKRREGMICSLYQKGYTYEEAQKIPDYAYINIWDKMKENLDIEGLDKQQIIHEINNVPYKRPISYEKALITRKEPIKIRVVEFGHVIVEITGFIEFEKFIMFCVCVCRPNTKKRNLRKIREVLDNVIEVSVKYENQESDHNTKLQR